MSRLFTTILFVNVCMAGVHTARILGVYPTPSISHQVVFRALTLELVKRGHDVVSITSDPVYKNKKSPENLREIDISESYNIMTSMLMGQDMKKRIKRGVILDSDLIFEDPDDSSALKYGMNIMGNSIFNFTAVKELIEDKSQEFDLIIMEGLSYAPLIFSKLFKAPVILFSSLYGTATNYEAVGAVARHPLFYPYVLFRNKFRNLSFYDKIEQICLEIRLWMFDQRNEKLDNEFLISIFGPDTPTVAELKKNVMLLFANTHPIFDGNRPVPPGVVYLGALHLQPVKELPQDLKSYLDNSTRGVVYVSLGTNVKPSFMDKEFLDAFLDAFEQLPYDILWKFDGDNLYRTPKNLKIQKWFPQRDLLCHPNIKLFVMQGGLQSTDEAIDAEVPLVGIPMLGDQWYNTNKYVELGIGVDIDSVTMNADDLVKAVNKVANDPSYKENIKKLKTFMSDQPSQALERAVWWTEYVLRHKDSRYLLGASAQTTWAKFLMLDVVAAAVALLALLAVMAAIAVYHILKLVKRIQTNVKVKKH